jgi:hypothetical protein
VAIVTTNRPGLALLAILSLAACEKKRPAQARLQFSNLSAMASVQAGADPAPVVAGGRIFKAKVTLVILDPDTSQPHGGSGGSLIWLNPECHDDEVNCEPSGGPGPANRITSLFDFSQPTDAVNAALNAQAREVATGAYLGAIIQFCKAPVFTDPNVSWSGPGLSGERTGIFVASCAYRSLPFDAPLVLAEGDSVTVTLSYDLGEAIQVGTPASPAGTACYLAGVMRPDGSGLQDFFDCVDLDATTRVSMRPPDFVPVVTKH